MSEEERLVKIPESWVSVAEAMRLSGYSRTHIHSLADNGTIDSVKVGLQFRLVDIDALLEHAVQQGRELPEVAGE